MRLSFYRLLIEEVRWWAATVETSPTPEGIRKLRADALLLQATFCADSSCTDAQIKQTVCEHARKVLRRHDAPEW
jgi:hypothetical protein